MHASNQYFFSCPFSKSVPRCTSRVSWLLAVLSVLGSAAFSGCGNSSTSGKYRVSGTVTLDGQDVTNGFVTFVPDGDQRAVPKTALRMSSGTRLSRKPLTERRSRTSEAKLSIFNLSASTGIDPLVIKWQWDFNEWSREINEEFPCP